jgi:hypothetical protein
MEGSPTRAETTVGQMMPSFKRAQILAPCSLCAFIVIVSKVIQEGFCSRSVVKCDEICINLMNVVKHPAKRQLFLSVLGAPRATERGCT